MKRNYKNIDYIITIPYRYITALSLGYLVLPICIFFLTWLKWYIGILSTAVLLTGYISLLKKTYKNNKDVIKISVVHFILIAVFLALWVWTTGIGNFFVSSYDHPWRIAIFRDLIDYSWPVIYPETGNALVYYFCYWLVPALIGKLCGWTAGNIALLIWTYLGLLLVFMMLSYICKIKSAGGAWIIALLLFGWSGLNIVGSAMVQILNMNLHELSLNGCEGWLDGLFNGYSFNFFYRTNANALQDIYNQTTPLWIATLFMLDNKDRIYNYAFIGLCLLPFAPLPFLGLVIYMLVFFAKMLRDSCKRKKITELFSNIFSMQNICAVVSIFPIMLLFYACNQTTGQGAGGGIMLLPLSLFDRTRIIGIILFWLLQFGFIAAFIWKKFRHDSIFYITVIVLVLCPFFEFGKRGGRDFCMNVPLPALFVLMCLTIIYINEDITNKILNIHNFCLLCVLILSFLSPIGRIAAELDTIGNQKKFPIINDRIQTFSIKNAADYENFLSNDPKSNIFFKYLSPEKEDKEYQNDLLKSVEYRKNNNLPFCSGNFSIMPKQDTSLYLNASKNNVFLSENKCFINILLSDDKYYELIFDEGPIALDVPNGVIDDAGRIQAWEYNGSSAQKYSIKIVDGYYLICYQDYALTYNLDTNSLYLSPETGEENQKWIIT